MRVEISPQIQGNSILLSLVAAANGIVEAELGPAADEVLVRWTDDSGGSGPPRLRLTVTDHGRCEETFTLTEFTNVADMRRRLRECSRRFNP